MKMLGFIVPVCLIVVLVDQWTKQWALGALVDQSIEVVPGWFSLTLAFNKGAAFGMLSGLPEGTRQLALSFATAFALIIVIGLLLNHYRTNRVGWLAAGLILGGAVGNIIDRVQLGMVVDFLDVYWNQYHWPTFNVADSCICVGVGILLLIKSEKITS